MGLNVICFIGPVSCALRALLIRFLYWIPVMVMTYEVPMIMNYSTKHSRVHDVILGCCIIGLP